MDQLIQKSLQYHQSLPAGKIAVVPTKACKNADDLSLAYTPGVAFPCLEIQKDSAHAYSYTGKGNLVAVISNGTAVLGLGDIGPLAGKPVMEGKSLLFKRLADINAFDLEIQEKDPVKLAKIIISLAPTFGGINLEDIKAPDCFYVEKEVQKKANIPVFHDDQHGTAIIVAAALMNALELAQKKLETVKIVFSGAGAAAFATSQFLCELGALRKNIFMFDSKGLITKKLAVGYKKIIAQKMMEISLTEALQGADIFIGMSIGNILTADMIAPMSKNPIIFALANPFPEIMYQTARESRPDAIVATGRSDFPNQVNNVLGFPFIFRGALDVQAPVINLQMKKAAVQTLAKLAHSVVPWEVERIYGQKIVFGAEYIIPKPLDSRVLFTVAPAVAQAAMDSGVARKPIVDMKAYIYSLQQKAKELGKSV